MSRLLVFSGPIGHPISFFSQIDFMVVDFKKLK